MLDALKPTGARVLLLGPRQHEKLGPPLPDPAQYNADLRNEFGELNDDEYRATVRVDAAGEHDLAWRFRADGGPWSYADLAPEGTTDGYQPARALALTVRACGDAP